MTQLSLLRARARLATRCALALCWLGSFIITHLPTPSGASDNAGAQQAVRRVWTTAADAAEVAGGLVPDVVDSIVDDKTLHLCLFLLLGLLWATSRAIGEELTARWCTIIVVVLAAYATISEVLQPLLGRVGDPKDVAAGVLGAVVGVASVAIGQWVLRGQTAPQVRPDAR